MMGLGIAAEFEKATVTEGKMVTTSTRLGVVLPTVVKTKEFLFTEIRSLDSGMHIHVI